MLDTLRRGASSWIAKGLLFLLILSFAVWGVADVFRGYSEDNLASVGSEKISAEEFRQTFQREMDLFSRRIGQRLTPEQARAFGIDRVVLQQIIGSTAVGNHARELGLDVSDTWVAKAITTDPTLVGADGSFSRQSFLELLRQAGFTEQGYLAQRRREEVRSLITESLLDHAAVPRALVDIMHAYREEQRSVEFFTIDPAKAVTLKAPDEAALTALYESDKASYMTPEYRKLAVLILSGDKVKSRIPVAEADVSEAYEADKSRFAVEEKRRIRQLAFKDRAAAEAARREITGGKSFLDVARAQGAKESDIELGELTRRQMLDPKIAEAAFALEKDKVSDVIEGQFAIVLLQASEISPGRQRPLEEVKEEIRGELQSRKLNEEIQRLHDLVDDNRVAGKPLKEIADTLKLEFVDIAAGDREGKDPDGKPVLEGPDAQRIMAQGFAGQIGVENETVELTDGGYAWVDVLGVTPSRQREYAAVRADVEKAWREAETAKQLRALAARLAERIANGEATGTLAAEVGGTLETANDLKRTAAPPKLNAAAVTQAFALPQGKAGSVATEDGKSRIMLKVTAITPAPPPTADQADALRSELAAGFQRQHFTSYLAALQDRYGVRVNQTVLQRATGETTTP